MNQFQKAFLKSNLVSVNQLPKQKKRKNKPQKCHKCGSPMIYVPETNVMVCSNDDCKNYYIFKSK